LLERKPHSGRKHSISDWAQDTLRKRLQQTQLGISAPYKTVHQLVRYRLGAAPKVARPKSIDNTDERVETYKKTWQRI
jgi:hypothetical protein